MEKQKKILIAGGSGLIGSYLTRKLLLLGYKVAILSRSSHKKDGIEVFQWDPSSCDYDKESLSQTDTIVNLAGAGIADRRWTAERKKVIINSRANAATTICSMLNDNKHQVRSVINASAIGFYGDRGSEKLDEQSAPSTGFLSQSTQEWEKHTSRIAETGVRNVILRIGVVLSNDGGAFPELKQTLPFHFLPIFGNGEQYISWIHIDDLCDMIIAAIENENISGLYNATAPHPLSNKQFMYELANCNSGFTFKIPVPKLALKLLLGEKAAVVLEGSKVSSLKIQDAGFQFRFPTIDVCLKNLTDA